MTQAQVVAHRRYDVVQLDTIPCGAVFRAINTAVRTDESTKVGLSRTRYSILWMGRLDTRRAKVNVSYIDLRYRYSTRARHYYPPGPVK